jgi:hypothetical protein
VDTSFGNKSFDKDIEMKILITIPHSHCPETDYLRKIHSCDTSAEKAGKILGKLFQRKGHDVILLIADKHRLFCDLNRKECRNTSYRKKLTKILNEGIDYLIDVHSFPKFSKDKTYGMSAYRIF